jgi:hypothetical protein
MYKILIIGVIKLLTYVLVPFFAIVWKTHWTELTSNLFNFILLLYFLKSSISEAFYLKYQFVLNLIAWIQFLVYNKPGFA